MQTLQKSIETALLKKLPEQILSRLLRDKLQEAGLVVSKRDHDRLIAHILSGNTAPFKLSPWQWWKKPATGSIEFTPGDLEKIGHLAQKVMDRLPEIIDGTTSKVASHMLSTLKRKWPSELKRQRHDANGFHRRLQGRWGPAIGSLRMLLTISKEFGLSINEETRANPSDESRYLVEVLTRLHARGSQVVEEIVSLLSSGLADGAMARWRTLHEITIVALFVSKQGNEVAERYIAHRHVESRKAALKYQECYERLGYEAMTPDEMKIIEDNYTAVIDRYGKDFRTDYGWASNALGNKSPKFEDIEGAVGLDHWRAHYRMAGHNVHANPKGAFFKLGLLGESNILLAGPSNAGLTDPGHSTAISLLQINSALLALQLTFDNLVALRVMLLLENEIGEMFLDADRRLQEDEAKLRQH